MCGIFGYIGPSSLKLRKSKPLNNATKIVFDGLKRLEYRGYDSWGIVTGEKGKGKREKLIIEKHIGKIGNSHSSLITHHSSLALGHTRWATHGGVTEANAHPHLDCTGTIAIVHNGIVENYQELRSQLKGQGHKFKSETDTEVIVHLIEKQLKGRTLIKAVMKAFSKLTGLNAIVVMSNDQLIAAKTGSPLVLGFGKDEFFVASDAAALLPHTRVVNFLEDKQVARLTKDGIEIVDFSGAKKQVKKQKLDWKIEQAELGKYPHFMIKEINEQPHVLVGIANDHTDEIESLARTVAKAKGTFIIGCGTASYSAQAGQYLFSRVADKHVNFSIGSEFNYLEHYLTNKSLVIAVSQSGETMDIIESVNLAKKKGAKIVAVVNVLGSSLWRLADYRLLMLAGPEKAVCATKTYSAMVANLLLLAYALEGKLDKGKEVILAASEVIKRMLTKSYILRVKKLAKKIYSREHIYIIGRGLSFASTQEAALKIKEVSYIHSEGFAGGELKHGVIALVEKGTPCIVFAPRDETHDAIISNALELKARGAYIIGISPKESEVFDYYLSSGAVGDASLIVDIVPVQLLAYFIAVEKGLDPDKPRNLAKSVTVK